MKIRDYVRTEKGIIGKYNIIKVGETIYNWNGGYGYKEIEKEYIDNIIYNRFDDKIIKSSPNIIDLIEVGDYVNGREVREVYDLGFGKNFYFKNEYGKHYDKSYKIKSIVTKEQFESIEYKVGE